MPVRILIVDDHAVVRRMLKVLVETQPNWKVCAEAENGEAAIAKVLEHNPDIVIMDMAMPVRDGISASREIAAKAPTTPIVMHTLHFSAELEIEAQKAGVWAVIPKAEASDELLKAIENVLGRAKKMPASASEAPRQASGSAGAGVPGRNGTSGHSSTGRASTGRASTGRASTGRASTGRAPAGSSEIECDDKTSTKTTTIG